MLHAGSRPCAGADAPARSGRGQSHGGMLSVCLCAALPCPQARKQAEAIGVSVRMDRLQAQAGGSMVTTNTLASMDEDDETALKRLNLILKVRRLPRAVAAWRVPPPCSQQHVTEHGAVRMRRLLIRCVAVLAGGSCVTRNFLFP